jgi:hypothetical protein
MERARHSLSGAPSELRGATYRGVTDRELQCRHRARHDERDPLSSLDPPVRERHMRPRFVGTRQHPRVIGGSSATQRYRAARGRARIAGKGVMRIDLASVVSKYIGQTERNIDRLLDEARQASAVLYFDEADHLFEPDQDAAGEQARVRFAAAKQYLRVGARRRRLSLVTGKPRPGSGTSV